jgi:hypothetical protein
MSKSRAKGSSYGTQIKKGGSTYPGFFKRYKWVGTSLMFKESRPKPLGASGSRLVARLSLVMSCIVLESIV